MVTLLLFLLLLSLIIVIHELGHLIAAKIFKVYCYEFSFGMGPKLFGWKGKETQYNIRAIPVGGYVSMAGENDGMNEIYQDIQVPENRTITKQKPWKKIIIMGAGIFMNFLLALVIFSMIFLANGFYRESPTAMVASVVPDSPAEKAGFMAGDVITKVQSSDGSVIHPKTFLELQTFMPQEAGEMVYTVSRDGQTYDLTVTPEYNADAQAYLIGISAPDSKIVKVNFLNCWAYGCAEFGLIVKMLVNAILGLFRGVGLDNMSGPVGIYTATETVAAMGLTSYIFLVGELSLNVGIFNLIPLPVLDGGRIVITIGEWIAHKPLNKKVEMALMGACWVLIIGLFLFVTWNDISRLFFQ